MRFINHPASEHGAPHDQLEMVFGTKLLSPAWFQAMESITSADRANIDVLYHDGFSIRFDGTLCKAIRFKVQDSELVFDTDMNCFTQTKQLTIALEINETKSQSFEFRLIRYADLQARTLSYETNMPNQQVVSWFERMQTNVLNLIRKNSEDVFLMIFDPFEHMRQLERHDHQCLDGDPEENITHAE